MKKYGKRMRLTGILMTVALQLSCSLAFLSSCKRQSGEAHVTSAESKQAKAMLQGIWIDQDTEEILFRAKGDTIYYPDSVNQPTHFRIVNDSLLLAHSSYPIVKQASHLFWFKNQNGDVVKLVKSDDPNDIFSFEQQSAPSPIVTNQLVKTDSIVMYGEQRYHWYIAINPTKYKVVKTSYSNDGVEVENDYYDNIIHLSLFRGAEKMFSSDLRKQMFNKQVPSQFLEQALLGDLQYDQVDSQGFHFTATLCIPDGGSCYLIEIIIDFTGQMSMKLLVN